MTEWFVSSAVLAALLIGAHYLLRGKISARLQYALWLVLLVRLLFDSSVTGSLAAAAVVFCLSLIALYSASSVYHFSGRGEAVLRRLKKQTETRLHDKLSLGVGGHINPTEEAAADPIEAGLRRELAEEVDVSDLRALTCVGVLNETTGGVSDYHAALVYVLETDGEVTVRETEKMSGTWATPAELDAVRDRLETWSQIALDAVIHGRAR